MGSYALEEGRSEEFCFLVRASKPRVRHGSLLIRVTLGEIRGSGSYFIAAYVNVEDKGMGKQVPYIRHAKVMCVSSRGVLQSPLSPWGQWGSSILKKP